MSRNSSRVSPENDLHMKVLYSSSVSQYIPSPYLSSVRQQCQNGVDAVLASFLTGSNLKLAIFEIVQGSITCDVNVGRGRPFAVVWVFHWDGS